MSTDLGLLVVFVDLDDVLLLRHPLSLLFALDDPANANEERLWLGLTFQTLYRSQTTAFENNVRDSQVRSGSDLI